MADASMLLTIGIGASLLGVGIGAQLVTHRERRRWAEVGLGLEERATGLASLTAIPVLFPSELETAKATGTKLAVIAFRRFTGHPEAFGRRLAAATRAHETGWRIDYDLFAVTVTVDDRDAALLAATRLGAAACGEETTGDLRVGVAMCPDDGTDMLDALDVALRRMRGFAIVDAVAGELQRRAAMHADAAGATPDVAAAG